MTTSTPTFQLFASNSSAVEMCQQVPSASVAMPPRFIALKVVVFGAKFAAIFLASSYHLSGQLHRKKRVRAQLGSLRRPGNVLTAVSIEERLAIGMLRTHGEGSTCGQRRKHDEGRRVADRVCFCSSPRFLSISFGMPAVSQKPGSCAIWAVAAISGRQSSRLMDRPFPARGETLRAEPDRVV
jgi:hypothetical protein